jgi:hypothetical protein
VETPYIIMAWYGKRLLVHTQVFSNVLNLPASSVNNCKIFLGGVPSTGSRIQPALNKGTF